MRISDWSSDVCSSDLPDDDQVIALVGAVDIDAAIACREGAVLGGIGGELVQQQGEAGHRAAGNLRIAAAQCDARRRVGGRIVVGGDDGLDEAVQGGGALRLAGGDRQRSEEHTSELQSLMRISYAVFCLTQKTNKTPITTKQQVAPTIPNNPYKR